jgi:hypothetical protein
MSCAVGLLSTYRRASHLPPRVALTAAGERTRPKMAYGLRETRTGPAPTHIYGL